MPLIKKASKKAFEQNVKSELAAGKPRAQSLAIAYSMKKRAGKKMAHGGEAEEMKPESIAQAILIRKKLKEQELEMAEGGEVDLQENSDEHLNEEDQLSFEAARKKTYYDLDQLEEQPEASNMIGDDLKDKNLHNLDMISSIRRKMKSKQK